MRNFIRKVFSLAELRYSPVLLLSIVICVIAFFIDEHVDPKDQLWLAVTYYVSFSLAALWCGINYIGHIRMNNLYRKHADIGAYVEQLAMSTEDKTELRNFLEDFAADLEGQGRTRQEAAKEVISQFQIREFLAMSKHTSPFESHGHHYLMGYGILFLGASLIALAAELLLSHPPLVWLIISSVAGVYGICFFGVYVLYKLLDRFIYNKLKKYFS
ncbi:MAG: hypothetical protein K0Q90_958 [Paenibacillaceae bacterium]|jgi:hypothetical protein|nr:hypothetical protein [Paenibacillaceae bacterium]